jgi:mannose-6-phosphate isomerase-like protein (cupin superfamily)
MSLNLSPFGEAEKDGALAAVEAFAGEEGFTIVAKDGTRPWGGFFVIDEAQAPAFAARFFPGEPVGEGKLSPKLLVVAPGKRLSWQYHHRRAELWRVLAGDPALATSPSDEEGPVRALPDGVVRLAQGERHRLIGGSGWGAVAEIWQHTDAAQPSDEQDIVRLQDDFGRSN